MWEAITGFFTTILYQPIYNGLVFLIDIVPGGEVGVAVIVLTLLVKLALLPLSLKSVRTQQTMKEVKPKIDEIKEKHSDDKEKQAKKMMEAYDEHNVMVQFPIIIALYYVFLRGGLPEFDPDLIYSFVRMPNTALVDMTFLGANLSEKSFVLALVAAGSQFVQSWMSDLGGSSDDDATDNEGPPESVVEEFKNNIGGQLQYIFPGIVFAISWTLPAVVALYWATSNTFHVFQEIYVKQTIKSPDDSKDK
jgi:YidC/Oxa1 family membrane protein insertase